MNEEEFLQHRSALVTRKSEKPKRLWDRARLLWEEIHTRRLSFLRAQVEIKELDSVTRDDLLGYFSVMYIFNILIFNFKKFLFLGSISEKIKNVSCF